MAMKRSDFPKSLEPGVRMYFGDTYDRYDPTYSKVFTMKTTKRAWEEDTILAGFGAAKQLGEGGVTEYDRLIEGWSAYYKILKWSLGFMVTEEAMEDNQYWNVTEKGTKYLAASFIRTAETVHADILNNAFDSDFVGGDGVELCATNHPTLGDDAPTLRNELSVAADLSEAALEQAVIDIGNFKDDRGMFLKTRAVRLVIPDELQFVAERILKSDGRVSTSDNDLNALKSRGVLRNDPVEWVYLTDPKAWFVQTDVDDGLKCYKRRAYKLKQWGDDRTGNYHVRASERYRPGWTNPRGLFGSPGVT